MNTRAPAIAIRPVAVRDRYWPILARLLSIESIIALAIALTVLAVAYREPLTQQTLSFGPEQERHLLYSYTYDDRLNGGKSQAAVDPRQPLAFTCQIRAGFQWPYCGFGITFDTTGSGKGIDLSKFDSLRLTFDYHGTAKLVRIDLRNHDPRYARLARKTDQPDEADFPIRPGPQTVPLALDDLSVAHWWKEQTRAPPELARPSYTNVVALELVTGIDSGPGEQRFQIRQITFGRSWVAPATWYGAIALCWMVLIASLLLYRRSQIAQLKHSTELLLRKREHLHRTILETSTDCIILFSRDGLVEFANGRALDAFAMGSLQDVVGQHWSEIWATEGRIVAADTLSRAAAGETVRMHYQSADEGAKCWDIVITPMPDDEGIGGVLSISRDVTAELEHTNQLKWASEHDALTHLPNRRAFQARLQAAILRAMETGEQIGLLLIDLDHFKHINDALGHAAGDELLKNVAERLRKGVREHDFVARIGGDEFAILLEQVASEETLLSVGNQVVSMIQSPLRTGGGRAVTAGASIGGALYPLNAVSANDLFKHADIALYALKQSGRGGTRLFDSYMLVEAEKSASQLRLARGAVNENSVVPAYQPKFELASGAIAGFEALLRWRHPRHGLQLPGTLEEAFSDYELAAKIGELMQRKVAHDMRQWLESGLEVGRVAINAAPAEFLRDDYAERMLAILIEHQVPPDAVEVEITEHAFFGRATEYVARALSVLKAANVTVSLDDFGTGYSSLSHLRDFPVDLVKIDMSFVQQMNENQEIAAIVAAVVSLARSLSIEVVAEGVETPAQLELLRAMGCHMAQGHLLSAAVEADAVPALVPSKRAAA